MTVCPSDDKLANLLADALSATERATQARHVEQCAACQDRLARLTEVPHTEIWRDAAPSPRGDRDEERVLQHLKQIGPGSAPTIGMPAPLPGEGWSGGADDISELGGGELPDVPGYEILGELG